MDEAPILFENFIREYNKKYDSKEKEERFKIFVNNLKRINDLNHKSTNAVHGKLWFLYRFMPYDFF